MTPDATVPKIGAVTIAPFTANPEALDFDTLYARIGQNTGNYMFTQAMYRNIAAQVEQIGFSFDPDQVNEAYSHVVIPAANWLSAAVNWDFLISRIERLKVPVTTIGIGLQAESTRLDAVQVSDSARRFVEVLSHKSASISTRGQFTSDWLSSVGIHNTVVTGCPSLYMNVATPGAPDSADGGVVLQSTRYQMSRAALDSAGLNSRIFRLVGELDLDMIYQSEIEEIGYLVYGKGFERLTMHGGPLLPALYGLPGMEEMQAFLDRHGKVFFSISDWAAYVKTKRLVAGTRLHGAILALNAGVDALLFPHDSRTQELVEFAAIPTMAFDTFEAALRGNDLASLGLGSAREAFRLRRARNAVIYQKFLAENGLAWQENTQDLP